MAGPADQPIDSVVCLHPDGRVTLFASNLHCVFGLQYLDGRLFVNHAPKLSVFTDHDGIGQERIDLLEYPNPRQFLSGATTHIPAGIHWAMDGYLYMAVGDVGIYRTTGKDGRTLSLQGGGIIRFRPDGTALEVYATGTRNHPDLALNAEGEIFTYDNTDDGNGWWTRVTHMVDGGFYGYPWDYKPRQPHTLWMMGDYLGGSGTAAFSYNEDALPPEFHGNLFLGDFGRSQMLRLKIEREGGSYAIRSRELVNGQDFITRGSAEFRPIGAAVSPDGLSFYITDWGTTASLAPVVTGRLIKATYTGRSPAQLQPGWVALAGTGKHFIASTGELLDALHHPAQNVRFIAQRHLSKRGSEAVPGLVQLLHDRQAPSFSRWSALWALDAMDGGVSARSDILALLKDPDASMRRQAARQLGTRSVSAAAPDLEDQLRDMEVSVRFQAATALGRIGLPGTVKALQALLEEPDLFTRYAAFTALQRIGEAHPEAWRDIVAGLSATNAAIREGTVFALRKARSPRVISDLSGYASNGANPQETRAGVLEVLGELARLPPEWQGDWWGAIALTPARRNRPPNERDWEGTSAAVATLCQSLNDPDLTVRRAAVSALVRCRETDCCDQLRTMLLREKDTPMGELILNALGELKDSRFAEVLELATLHPGPNDSLLTNAIAMAGHIGSPALVTELTRILERPLAKDTRIMCMRILAKTKSETGIPALGRQLEDPEAVIWRAALNALYQIGTDQAAAALAQKLTNSRPEMRDAIIATLAKIKSPAAVANLVSAYHKTAGDESSRQSILTALIKAPDVRALDIYAAGLRTGDATVQRQCTNALAAIQQEVLPLIEDRLEKDDEFIPGKMLPLLKTLGGSLRPGLWRWVVLSQAPGKNLAQSGILANTTASVEGKPLTGRINPQALLKNRSLPASSSLGLVASLEYSGEQTMEITARCSVPIRLWFNGSELPVTRDAHTPFHRANVSLKHGTNQLAVWLEQPEMIQEFSVVLSPSRLQLPAEAVAVPKEVYATWARSNRGNPDRGRRWFEDPTGAGCVRCHRVGGDGGASGPDLAGIADKLNREQLIESVLYPSRNILTGYQQSFIKTKDGESVTGCVQHEDQQAITFADATGRSQVIRKAEIIERSLSPLSPMPEDLHLGWSREQFTDLITYLESLKTTKPVPK